MQTTRSGTGKPLLLVHGLGSNHRSWGELATTLASDREVLAIDLPGHGGTPPESDSATFAGLARSLEEYLRREQLAGADLVGISMGGRLVLEMARRGLAGNVVALDPGGFWEGWERTMLRSTLLGSHMLLRLVRPGIPLLARHKIPRALLLAQLSARSWDVDPGVAAQELDSYARTPTFVGLVNDLASGPAQQGPAAANTGRLAIGWGRMDRLCVPAQASRAQAAFPSASLHWFARSGHFPTWDAPEETLTLIRETVA